MIGILISSGAGLAATVGLLIWVIVERGKRHAAEQRISTAEKLRDEAVSTANQNARHAAEMGDQAARLTEQVQALNDRLAEVRDVVATNASITMVRKLLEDEAKPEGI